MSYTNGTTHYNLPLTTGADKRDWADTNQSFSDIDAALYGAVQDTAQAELDIDALETRMDTAEQNISTNTGNIAGLDTRVTTVEGAITSLSGQVTDSRQDLEDMICAYNEASAASTHAYAIGDYFIYNDVLYRAIQAIAIGDTIVPDTNCTTTNVTSELLGFNTTIIHAAVANGIKSFMDLAKECIDRLPNNFSYKYDYAILDCSLNSGEVSGLKIYRLSVREFSADPSQIVFVCDASRVSGNAFLDDKYVIGYQPIGGVKTAFAFKRYVQYSRTAPYTPTVTITDISEEVPSANTSQLVLIRIPRTLY